MRRLYSNYRIAEMETLDVGLSKEEDTLNNLGPRELIASDRDASLEHVIGKRKLLEEEDLVLQPAKRLSLLDEYDKSKGNEGEGEKGRDEVPPPPPPAVHRRLLNRPKSSVNGVHCMAVARPVSTMKGHTAFLTFAVRPLLKSDS